jgi:S1-C subfamily serine protease
MAFCNECGARLPAGARFCAECGESVERRGQTPPRRSGRGKHVDGRRSSMRELKEELRSEIEDELPGAHAAVSEARIIPDEDASSFLVRNETGRSRRTRKAVAGSPYLRLDAALLPQVKAATVFVHVGDVDSEGRFRSTSSGSGFVIDRDGWIVTNRHVVHECAVALAVFHCGTDLVSAVPAEIVLGESPVDLALLRVGIPDDVPALEVGDSGEVGETDSMWALGYPLGVNLEIILRDAGYQPNRHGPEVSVREGTITAIRHDTEGRVKLLEHNCNIAPGNSGGPLVDRGGRVVGVNTLGLGHVEPAEVTNFAIPSKVLAEFMGAVGGPAVRD